MVAATAVVATPEALYTLKLPATAMRTASSNVYRTVVPCGFVAVASLTPTVLTMVALTSSGRLVTVVLDALSLAMFCAAV